MDIIDDSIAEFFSAEFLDFEIGVYDDFGQPLFCERGLIAIEDNDGQFSSSYV